MVQKLTERHNNQWQGHIVYIEPAVLFYSIGEKVEEYRGVQQMHMTGTVNMHTMTTNAE